jgi:2-oxoisovalerate dehydrogenase E2 component (dihydrolipoyl transacylase)
VVFVFDLPDLAEGTTEAQILEWLVQVGDTVTIDQDIVEVETAKAVVVIPSPTAGVVAELHGPVGAVMEVGKPLITFNTATQTADPEKKTANLVGYGPSSDHRGRRRRPAASSPAEVPDEVPSRPLAKPPVRKLAKELGVHLGSVAGTGVGGIVTRADVEEATQAKPPAMAAPVATPAPPPASNTSVIPVTGIRRTIAQKMEMAHAIPTASAWLDADATGLMRLRASLKKSHPDAGITPMAIVMFLTVKALNHVPVLNAHYRDGEIHTFSDVHLAFAASTDRGLLVPTARDAHNMSIVEIAAELRRLTNSARDGSIKPNELIGSTFTISNYGSLGMDGGIPLMNHPNTGILGIGAITDKAVVEAGQVVIRPTVNLSLSFDHRVCDGAEASEFLTFLAQAVADPAVLLL